jgi:uncharacterized membrane protein
MSPEQTSIDGMIAKLARLAADFEINPVGIWSTFNITCTRISMQLGAAGTQLSETQVDALIKICTDFSKQEKKDIDQHRALRERIVDLLKDAGGQASRCGLEKIFQSEKNGDVKIRAAEAIIRLLKNAESAEKEESAKDKISDKLASYEILLERLKRNKPLPLAPSTSTIWSGEEKAPASNSPKPVKK